MDARDAAQAILEAAEKGRSGERYQLQVVSDKAMRELGVRFRPVEETLRDEVEWYRSHQ